MRMERNADEEKDYSSKEKKNTKKRTKKDLRPLDIMH